MCDHCRRMLGALDTVAARERQHIRQDVVRIVQTAPALVLGVVVWIALLAPDGGAAWWVLALLALTLGATAWRLGDQLHELWADWQALRQTRALQHTLRQHLADTSAGGTPLPTEALDAVMRAALRDDPDDPMGPPRGGPGTKLWS